MSRLKRSIKSILLSGLILFILGMVRLPIDDTRAIPQETILPVNGTSTFRVTYVVDGDTFKFKWNNEEITARLIGIDTPEKNHPRKPVECFAVEASIELKRILLNKDVYLEYDSKQDKTDIYGRMLVHVWLKSREDLYINKYMVEKGFAYAYRKLPSQSLDEFIDLEKIARKKHFGLWGECK